MICSLLLLIIECDLDGIACIGKASSLERSGEIACGGSSQGVTAELGVDETELRRVAVAISAVAALKTRSSLV